MAELPAEGLPELAKWAVTLSAAIAGAISTAMFYLRRPRKSADADEFVIEGGEIADLRPIRELAVSSNRTAKALEDIRDMMKADRERAEAQMRAELMAELRRLRNHEDG
ncbi:hypothetical protein K32_23810 [Kaistia sp. 32K]|uniref:hypothetical protein n=1 Tax=Kaistia sp. 32K TaxID=2795690 RepID=UPI0019164411|nr:hypothetical protein [Kaistia sp. 32K]BCP53764.1 hypothetical protein K32_23810 [Kaistia sp. 32K]